ncbi:MAG: hypothetical protein M3137_10220, partial [Actinomycetota bacterium]|nr:hypothetical protein [Actinomycetota bacterium]
MSSSVRKLTGALLISAACLVAGGGLLPAATAVASSQGTDPVLVAAGDIACSPSDSAFAGNDGTSCQMRATANEIASIAPQYLLPIGDTQYNDFSMPQGTQPTSADYANSYDPTWGRLGARVPGLTVRPVAGNHEYGDVVDSDQPPLASGQTYFDNFGPGGLNELPPAVTNATTDHYSYDIPVNGGSWHVIELDSECAAVGGCAAGSPEETWLRNDLATHPNSCTMAAWHEPRWASGGAGNDDSYAAFWNDLVSAHAALVLNGHDHFYQHFGSMDASGNATTSGVSEFIVGTGGEDHGKIGPPTPTVVAQDGNDFGALKMTLHAASASYAMQTTSGGIVDSGSVACAGKPTQVAGRSGGSYVPLSPSRIVDSRIGQGAVTTLGAGQAVTVTMPASVPQGASAVALNVTEVDATAPGYLSVYPAAGGPPPLEASLNFVAGPANCTVPDCVVPN